MTSGSEYAIPAGGSRGTTITRLLPFGKTLQHLTNIFVLFIIFNGFLEEGISFFGSHRFLLLLPLEVAGHADLTVDDVHSQLLVKCV